MTKIWSIIQNFGALLLVAAAFPAYSQEAGVSFEFDNQRPGYIANICETARNLRNNHTRRRCIKLSDQRSVVGISVQMKLIAAIERNTAAISKLQNDISDAKVASVDTKEKIAELSNEIRRQNTTALQAIQGQLLTKLDAIPITLVNDEQVYQALKKRLTKDIGEAFSLD